MQNVADQQMKKEKKVWRSLYNLSAASKSDGKKHTGNPGADSQL